MSEITLTYLSVGSRLVSNASVFDDEVGKVQIPTRKIDLLHDLSDYIMCHSPDNGHMNEKMKIIHRMLFF